MPKKRFELLRFEGYGINESNPRKLKSGELSAAIDFIEAYDKIRPMGGTASEGTVSTATGASIAANYGLFEYGHDRDYSGSESPTRYIVMPGSAAGEIDFWDGGAWRDALVDLGSTDNKKFVYHVVDGALRACDSEFGANNRVKWYNYISRKLYNGCLPNKLSIDTPGTGYAAAGSLTITGGGGSGAKGRFTAGGGQLQTAFITCAGTGYTSLPTVTAPGGSGGVIVWDADADIYTTIYDLWYSSNNDLAAPTECAVGATYPTAATGFNLSISTPVDGNSSWPAKTYQVALSFVYDHDQESLLYVPTSSNTFAVASGDSVTIAVYGQGDYNKRIVKSRVYCRVDGSDDEWILLAEIDLQKGVRVTLNTDIYAAWNGYDNDPTVIDERFYSDAATSLDQNVDTYETINGYSPDEESIDIGGLGEGYKTSVVINRTTYVGNTRRKTKDGIVVVEGDAIYKSVPNRFDTLPASFRLVAAKGDAEDIVKLEAYADRILEFKQNTLRIINVSQDIEFIEGVYKNRGVTTPAAVCLTDYGIAWVNEFGLFFFDGKSIMNLLERKGQRLIKLSTWQSFITSTSQIGYYADTNQLIIAKSGAASSTTVNVYIYDFVLGAFYTGSSKFTLNVTKTNFVVQQDGILTYAETSGANVVMKKWDDAEQTTSVGRLDFHDEVFASNGVEKYIYKIYFIYMNNYGSSPADDIPNKVYYCVDGADSVGAWTNSGLSCTFQGGVGDWTLAVATFSSPLKCESIRIRVVPGTNCKLEIKSIVAEIRILPNASVT